MAKGFKIQSPENKEINGSIILPSSKSESNRALVIKALSNEPISIINLSTADDTCLLEDLLSSKDHILDTKNAGTVLRFLTAYFAVKDGCHKILTGNERMKYRPITPLVDGLRQLGCDIQYLERNGYPPIEITGKKIEGGLVQIDTGISSQFLSALLLIAPTLNKGLEIKLLGEKKSFPYVEMTLKIMADCGIKYKTTDMSFSVPHQAYKESTIQIENDWSSAAFWFEMAALSKNCNIQLNGLNKLSHQGDQIVTDIFNDLGINSRFSGNNMLLTKSEKRLNKYFSFDYNNEEPRFIYDFSHFPDLVPPLAATLCGLNIKGTFSGVKNLKHKESNRILSLKQELKKFGTKVNEYDIGAEAQLQHICFDLLPEKLLSEGQGIVIDSHDDHRIVMSIAPLCLKYTCIIISNPEVVAKSYPNFWEDIKSVGFSVEKIEI